MANDIFCNRAKERMAQLSKKQRKIAEECGITEVTLSRYFNGLRIPKAPTVARIAESLNTTSDYLLGKDDKQDPQTAHDIVIKTIKKHMKNWTREEIMQIVVLLWGISEK